MLKYQILILQYRLLIIQLLVEQLLKTIIYSRRDPLFIGKSLVANTTELSLR